MVKENNYGRDAEQVIETRTKSSVTFDRTIEVDPKQTGRPFAAEPHTFEWRERERENKKSKGKPVCFLMVTGKEDEREWLRRWR